MIKDFIVKLMKEVNEEVVNDERKRRRMRDAFAGERGSSLRPISRSE